MAKRKKTATSYFSRRISEGLGIFCLLSAVYLALTLMTYYAGDPSFNNATPAQTVHNMGGLLGSYLSDLLIMLFGLAAFVPVMLLVVYATLMMAHRPMQEGVLQVATFPLVLLSACAVLQLTQPLPEWPLGQPGFGNGGLTGKLLVVQTAPLIGGFGCALFFMTLLSLSTLWFFGGTFQDVGRFLTKTHIAIVYWSKKVWRVLKRIKFKKAAQFDLPLPTPKMPSMPKPKPQVVKPKMDIKPAARLESERQTSLPLTLENSFQLPPLSLLDEAPAKQEGESEDALTQNARRIEAELKNFNILGQVTKICPGPVITIYELEPAAGVKTSQIIGLSDDLARAMSAMSIRIAPIPGRNVIGIELPNHNRAMITLRELLQTEDFETSAGKLTVALGVDTSGNPTYADIGKMPHALIAGTTGSGKSVAMNAFILSLLYRMTPEQLKFVMIDPKMLELSIYNDIPHLLTPVITDPNKAAAALNWTVKEMENRYRLMSEMGVKNIASFNAKFEELQAKGEIPTRKVQTGFDIHTGQPQYEEKPLAKSTFPHIVVVIDELADLMMVAGKAVEMYIARLTQMARASGIHLLIATQRPSVDVVTGLIKANIPTRMSFNVTSKIDSRTVLDSMGAESLLGKGDMLYMGNGSNALERMHGAFVSEDECNKVADHLRAQAEPQYVDSITKGGGESGGAGGGDIPTAGEGGEDNTYHQAIQIVAREQKASTSFLQRQLKIGYNRAADLIDRMEADGLISEANHVGKREVIMKKPEE